MNTVIKDKQIEEIKQELINTLQSLKDNLIDDYLHHFGKIVNIKMDTYEDCYVSRQQWSEESYQEAIDFANNKLSETLKDININQLN